MAGESARTADGQMAEVAAAIEARVRHDWLDALKGIGIILVVAGHIWTRGPFRDAIYTFHMPLFFMASGAVTRAVPVRVLLPRMGFALGVPFLSFSAALLGLDFLVEGLRGVRPVFPDLWAGIATILLATEKLRGPFGILWFVPCLFIARLIWNSLLIRLGGPNDRLMLLVMALVALIAVAVDQMGGRSPLGLLPVPAALLMIWAGSLWRDWRPGRAAALALAAVALLALFLFFPLNLRAGEIGWPLAGLAGAVAIVDRLAWLTRRLPLRTMHSLAWIGRNSLVVMFAHLAFVHYLWAWLPKPALFATALAGSLLIGWLAQQSRPTRLLFLGEKRNR
ncbi:MAG: acyltransferase family protein [Sphingobium sp.]|nr:acyltransferase family protein [Sphingobium sp.]